VLIKGEHKMKNIKYILVLSCANIVLFGCSNTASVQNYTPHTVVSQIKQDQNKLTEAIVVFKKGMTIRDAKEVVISYGMQVLKVYTAISESTHKPMLHIGSSLPMEEMMQQLGKDSRISSVSPNYKRDLYKSQ